MENSEKQLREKVAKLEGRLKGLSVAMDCDLEDLEARAQVLLMQSLSPSGLTMDDYQRRAKHTSVYVRSDDDLVYPTLGLASEAGEVAGEVKRIIRDDDGRLTESRRAAILTELGDTLWYLSAVASALRASLSEVASDNLRKLQGRHVARTIRGSGDR
jgi:NTP pyrophosphatase (non-canonical NTP hydrolase)